MKPLNRKLFRELAGLKGQILAISLVIASGIATLIMSLSTITALQVTTDEYYKKYQFADVFASLTRAPQFLTKRFKEIEGIDKVSARIKKIATIDVDDFDESVTGLLISIPTERQPELNQLVLRTGRWISDDQSEIIVNEPFAEAHGLINGDKISILMNGSFRQFTIVGTALCPEYVYALGPGSLLPDDLTFGIFWLNQETLEAAYNLKNAFNDITFRINSSVEPNVLLYKIDKELEPYGGIKAITRSDQLSSWFVDNEIEQMRSLSTILPTIFLLVSAFLTNMVLNRLITNEREQIGLLKAFGYTNWQVGIHYIKFVLVMCTIGIIIGILLGSFLGKINTQNYANFFRFPLLIYRPSTYPLIISALISTSAAILGAIGAIYKVIKLPPAVAMVPPAPEMYKKNFFDNKLIKDFLDQPTRIAVRQIIRKPIRSFLTASGIAMSVGLLIMALQWNDAIRHLGTSYFNDAQRQNIMLSFYNDQQRRALQDIKNLPGVIAAEPMKSVAVEFYNGNKKHRGSVIGIEKNSILQPAYDDYAKKQISLTDKGVIIGDILAKKLKLNVGDSLWLDFLEKKDLRVQLEVVEIIRTYIGMPAYLELSELNNLLAEPKQMQLVNLVVDSNQYKEFYETVKKSPNISAILTKEAAINAFNTTLAEQLLVFMFIFITLSSILGFGVAYNAIRISLSERSRELATLRVLGFTKNETSYILFCEMALLIIVGLILGCFVGYGLILIFSLAFETELFRIPVLLKSKTFSIAILIEIIASFLSIIIIQKQIKGLDMIEVLKTKE